MERALALSEIRDYIVRFLDPFDLASCALVSKTWSISATPWLYRTVGLQQGLNLRNSFERLRERGRLVRHLIINQMIKDMDIFNSCTQLQTLDIRSPCTAPDLQAAYARLVKQNLSTLKEFRLDRGQFTDKFTSQGLCVEVTQCPELIRLELRRVALQTSPQLVEGLTRLCTSQLRSLALADCSFPTDSQWLGHEAVFINLTSLNVAFPSNTNAVDSFSDFASRCPNLLFLEWYAVGEEDIVSAMTHRIIPSCPRLEVVRIATEKWDTNIRFQLIEALLHPKRRVKWVDIQPSKQRTQPELDALFARLISSGIFETLEAVQLDQNAVSGAMAQSILCLCPRLRAFQAEKISTDDISIDVPWVCDQLEYLKVHFFHETVHTFGCLPSQQANVLQGFPDTDSSSTAYFHDIFCRLSKLRQLRVLDVTLYTFRSFPKISPQHGIRFQLGQGLELLEGLKKLEWIEYLRIWPHPPSGQDVLFMINAWPNLRHFSSNYVEYSLEVRQQIAQTIKKRGPIMRPACATAYDHLRSTYF